MWLVVAFYGVQILNRFLKVVFLSIETVLIKYKVHAVFLQDCIHKKDLQIYL